MIDESATSSQAFFYVPESALDYSRGAGAVAPTPSDFEGCQAQVADTNWRNFKPTGQNFQTL